MEAAFELWRWTRAAMVAPSCFTPISGPLNTTQTQSTSDDALPNVGAFSAGYHTHRLSTPVMAPSLCGVLMLPQYSVSLGSSSEVMTPEGGTVGTRRQK